MLKKMLLALGVAWTGTAAAASNSLDDVTMNIVNETAFQEIISANPAEIERILQVNANAQPLRAVVLQNLDGAITTATPVNGQVLTVNKELNQGMVSFSFICAEGQDCQQRVENLNSTSGFVLSAPAGSAINVMPGVGIEIAPQPGIVGEFFVVEGVEFDGSNAVPVEGIEFDPEGLGVIEGGLPGGAGIFTVSGQ